MIVDALDPLPINTYVYLINSRHEYASHMGLMDYFHVNLFSYARKRNIRMNIYTRLFTIVNHARINEYNLNVYHIIASDETEYIIGAGGITPSLDA